MLSANSWFILLKDSRYFSIGRLPNFICLFNLLASSIHSFLALSAFTCPSVFSFVSEWCVPVSMYCSRLTPWSLSHLHLDSWPRWTVQIRLSTYFLLFFQRRGSKLLEATSLRPAQRPDCHVSAGIRLVEPKGWHRVQDKDHDNLPGHRHDALESRVQRADAEGSPDVDAASLDSHRARSGDRRHQLYLGQRHLAEVHGVRIAVHRRRPAKVCSPIIR